MYSPKTGGTLGWNSKYDHNSTPGYDKSAIKLHTVNQLPYIIKTSQTVLFLAHTRN